MGTQTSRASGAGMTARHGSRAHGVNPLCCSAPSDVAMKQSPPLDFTDLRTAPRRHGVTKGAEPLPSTSASRNSGNYYTNERKRQLSRRKAERCSQVAHREPQVLRRDAPAAEVNKELLVATSSPSASQSRQRLSSSASAHSVRTVAHKPIRRPRPCWSDAMFNARSTDHAGRANAGAFPILAIGAPSASCADGGCAAATSAL